MVSIALHKLIQLFLADTPPPTDLVRLEPTFIDPVINGIDMAIEHRGDLLPTKIFFQQNPPFRIETCGKVCYTVLAYISILPFRPRFVCGVVLFAYLIYHTETHKSSGKCSISMNKVLKCVGVFSLFYERYLELCRSIGMAPTTVARKVGISSRTAADWGLGAEPRAATKRKLANFFKVDVSYFDQDDSVGSDDDNEVLRKVYEETKEYRKGLSDDENLIIMAYRTASDVKKAKILRYVFQLTLEKDDDETR